MKRANPNKGNKRALSKQECIDNITPRTNIPRTAVALAEFKLGTDNRTRPVCSKDYGFTCKPFTMYVSPAISEEDIRQRFYNRIFGNQSVFNQYATKNNMKI